MSEELPGDLRSAFESFEKSLGTREAIKHLREAIDLYLDILDGENGSEENKTIAKNLGETYWMKFAESVVVIADNPGRYDFDTCKLWFDSAMAFRDENIGEKYLNELILWGLIESMNEASPPNERASRVALEKWRQESLEKLKKQK